MKTIIIAICCLSILSTTYAQTEKADAEYLKIKKEYTLNEDGSIDFHYSKSLKLLSHFAFHRLYGETFIIYNTEFQALTINSAYTIMADGKKVNTPDNAFNEVLPRFANNAPAYNHIREMVVTHTGLEVGAVIYLDYTLHSEKGYFPALMFNEVLNESSPVKALEVIVKKPATNSLNYKLLNMEGEPTVGFENGQQVYTWNFKDLAASSKENHQVSGHLDAPRLVFSSAEDLNAVFSYFVSQDAFSLENNAQMDALVEKVLSENPDQLSAALALQKIVANNLGKLNIPLEYTGFKLRSPVDTWESNQGTEPEKALLLSALLKKSDIPATPVAIIPDLLFDKKMGDLLSFREFAVMLELENGVKVLLSSNHTDDQNLVYSMADQSVLKLDPNLKSPAVFSTVKGINQIKATAVLDMNDSVLSGSMNLELAGAFNPYFSIIGDASAIKSVFQGGITSKDIQSFTNIELSQEKVRTQVEIKKADDFEMLHNYLSFDLPYIKGGVQDWHFYDLTTGRISAVEIPDIVHEKYEYTITFPDKFKLVTEPMKVELENDAGYLLILFEESKGKLVITREIKFTKRIIDTVMYEGFREIMNAWNHVNFQKLIFKK